MKRWLLALPLLLVCSGSCDGDGQTNGDAGDAGADPTGGGSGGTGPMTGGGGSGASVETGGGGQGGAPSTAVCAASSLLAPPLDCNLPNVRCVDDSAGANQEYMNIQEAADAAGPGDTVLVFEGVYSGFQVDVSGSVDNPVVFYASGDVQIDMPAATGDGIRLQNVSHVQIIGFHVSSVPERCIAARGATPEEPMVDLWIVGNTCKDAAKEGFYLSEVKGSHVELNAIHGTGVGGDIRSHGIYLANAGSDGTTICGNIISGAEPEESNGIHMNGDLSIGGDGIISSVVVEANIIYGNFQNGLNLDGVQDSVFRNNLIYDNGRNALRAYAIDAAAGPKGLVIANNTFLTPDGGGWALKLSEDEGGHVLFNNILLSDDPDTGSIALADPPGFECAYNVVGDRFTLDDESTILSFEDWQAQGYAEGSSLGTAAALFVAPGSDFHLKAGAPAIDAGIEAYKGNTAPAADLDGKPRPQGGKFDIGAYEAP